MTGSGHASTPAAGVDMRPSSPGQPLVASVNLSPEHGFSKQPTDRLELRANFGVVGDAHAGERVQHLSRVARDPTQPNLRQVHLIHAELLDELRAAGHEVGPGDMGENITTRGLDILALPEGARLHIGEAILEVTGLRNPCAQIEAFEPGLLEKVIERRPDGSLVRKAGIMTIVLQGGSVRPGDEIRLALPAPPHKSLAPV